MACKNFSLLLARRYLKPKRTYVSVITLISVVGVMLGVGVLMVVIAVMAGFESEFKKLVLGIEPHLTVVNRNSHNGAAVQIPGDTDLPVHWQKLVADLQMQPGVERAYPIINGMILLTYDGPSGTRGTAARMRAVDEAGQKQLAELNIIEGEPDVSGTGIAISRGLADDFDLVIGSELDAILSRNMEKLLDSLNELDNQSLNEDEKRQRREDLLAPQSLQVTAIFNSPRYAEQVFVGLETGRELFEFEEDYSIHGVALTTNDAYKAKETAPTLLGQTEADGKIDWNKRILPPGYGIVTWMDQHQAIFDQIRMERGMMYFVLFFIMLVAAFSIMNTMITVTVQKNREIGVMKAMGARVSQIVNVFLIQGFTVGIVGTILGYLGGLLVIWNRDAIRSWMASIGFDIFPAEVYGGLNELPAKIVPIDTMFICGGALFLCTIAALPPAYFVARLDPAKALRGTGTMS